MRLDTFFVFALVAAALVYVVSRLRRSLGGKAGCGCAGDAEQAKPGCCGCQGCPPSKAGCCPPPLDNRPGLG